MIVYNSLYNFIYMKHFFPGIIAQDIRKVKSENIELFKNALNKLLNIKNHFIITHMHIRYI